MPPPHRPHAAVLARIRRSVSRPDLEHLYDIQNRLDKAVARVGKIKVRFVDSLIVHQFSFHQRLFNLFYCTSLIIILLSLFSFTLFLGKIKVRLQPRASPRVPLHAGAPGQGGEVLLADPHSSYWRLGCHQCKRLPLGRSPAG